MTIHAFFKAKLEEHGLWPEEAEAVMETAKTSEMLDSMRGRWDDDKEGYPASLWLVVWMSIESLAVEHLRATKPQHFALQILRSPADAPQVAHHSV